ncbi:hypothetical protein CDD80_1729 [Ophiocordyceps camponoti-rufipedis]|uniref:Uncharacterized protein n=1 Tax=Ophiocordyceps camponoti-rufipedis TaxID=2004952 RepID=A0A2C5Z865_9HYPO|nr:hypothetical protein CDD80_1729 [Ophiocordyceps camponoti-rufipedis]
MLVGIALRKDRHRQTDRQTDRQPCPAGVTVARCYSGRADIEPFGSWLDRDRCGEPWDPPRFPDRTDNIPALPRRHTGNKKDRGQLPGQQPTNKPWQPTSDSAVTQTDGRTSHLSSSSSPNNPRYTALQPCLAHAGKPSATISSRSASVEADGGEMPSAVSPRFVTSQMAHPIPCWCRPGEGLPFSAC